MRVSEQAVAQRERSTDAPLPSMPEPGVRAPAGRAHRTPKIRGRAREVAVMSAWRRWQDWVVVGLGVILFLTPLVFGETAMAVAASTAYILGVLIVLAGLLNATTRQPTGLEIIPAALAVILFVSPWAFGFTAVPTLAWSAWIVAVMVVLAVGSLLAMQNRPRVA